MNFTNPRILLLCLLLTTVTVSAAPPVIPGGPAIAARGYLLQDFHSGRILQENNPDERVEPASLTKLMTAYIVFSELQSGRIKLTDKAQVSEKAWRMGGSRMYLEVDSEVTVEELLKGMIIQSGNDASIVLAEFMAGSEETFASMMNQYATQLGLKNTHYENSTGMPADNHYTTARDMARMAAALIRQFPEYYKYYSQKEYTYNNITQRNRNRLLWRNAYVDGVKTGYTEAAGYCLVSSAQQNNMRLIAVVMGADSANARVTESQKLLTYGFRFFETHKLYEAGQTVDTQRIWQGTEKHIRLGPAQELYVTVPRGQYPQLKPVIQVAAKITAPIQTGAVLGTLQVKLHDQVLAERPLTALHTVKKGSWFRQLTDYVLTQF